MSNILNYQSNNNYIYTDQVDALRIMLERNVFLTGPAGSGKTFCMCYCLLYAFSKGLYCLSLALMAKRSIELGGIHWHKLLCIP